MGSQRIAWLDLLRGLAAIAIVAYHFHRYLGIRHASFGFVAVDVFFALSGIVLSLKYARRIEGDMGPLEFTGVRLRRLYPMVAITGLFIVGLNLAGVPAGTHAEASATHAWNVFAIEPVTGASAGSAFPADPPLWSLWAELAANAVWFAVLKAGRRWMLPLGVVSAAILVAGVAWMNTLNVGWEAGAVPRLISLARALASFTLGYAIARRELDLRRSALLLAAALAAFELFTRLDPGHDGANEALCALSGLALLNLVYRLPPPGALVGRIARWLGMLSFPLYLIHVPAGRLLPYLPKEPAWISLLLVVAGIAIAATLLNELLMNAVAWLSHPRAKASAVPQGNG